MAILPTIKEMSEEVAERVFDEYIYKGKTLREWIEALVQSEKALEADPREDAISRKAALEAILIRLPDFCGDEGGNLVDRNEAASAIRNLPSVTPKQKKGKWNILGYDDPSVRLYKCSECHMTITLKFNYCPNCGAKMVEGKNENDKY